MIERGDEQERPLAMGPTGRVLHPVGALFEAAFRRVGQHFGAYLLYTVLAALPAALLAYSLDRGGASGWGMLGAILVVYAIGHLALVGLLAALVTGGLRERMGSIALTVVVGGVVLGAASTLLPPLALLVYPFVVLGPIAAAAGDRTGPAALVHGAAIAGRALGRTALVVAGLLLVSLFLWFGFVIALSPLRDTAQQVGAFAAVTLLVWPVAALVQRNLYGDLTGRLVIREAPGESERQARLKRRGRRRG